LINKDDIVISIAHALRMPWTDILYKGQCKTWLKEDLIQDFNILHFYGNPPNKIVRQLEKLDEIVRSNFSYINFIRKLYFKPFYFYFLRKTPSSKIEKLYLTNMNSMKINIVDINPFVIFKILSTLEWFVNETQYKYLYITTTSSYLRITKLISHINSIQVNVGFGGSVLKHNEIEFISGANRLFSREVAESILRNKHKLDFFIPEDVAFSKLVVSLGHELLNLPTLNIDSEQKLLELTDSDLRYNFHFRLKSVGSLKAFNMVNASYDEKVKRDDVKLMYLLHERVSQF
jgi:hypothetical protein